MEKNCSKDFSTWERAENPAEGLVGHVWNIDRKKKYSSIVVPATNQKCQELKTSISYVTHLSQFRAWTFYKVPVICQGQVRLS